MTLEEFLSRLEGVQRMPMEPSKYVAKCPAHNDRSASLSLTDEGARWLIHCHAGCAYGSIMLAVGARPGDNLGVHVRRPGDVVNIGDVRPAQTAKAPSTRPTSGTSEPRVQMPPESIVQGWERSLAQSPQLLARLHELKGWSEKTLKTVRAGWDGDRITFPLYAPDRLTDGVLTAGRMVALVRYVPGGEPKSLAAGPRGLWPAPESLPFSDALWLVEGEPDRVSGVEIGLNVASLPGIGKWGPDWAPRFRGRRVVVCLDCDESCCPAAREGGGKVDGSPLCGACGKPRRSYGGRDHAAKVVGLLRGAGVDAAAVDLFPARADGYDLGDALTAATADGRVNDLRRYLMRLEDSAWRAAA